MTVASHAVPSGLVFVADWIYMGRVDRYAGRAWFHRSLRDRDWGKGCQLRLHVQTTIPAIHPSLLSARQAREQPLSQLRVSVSKDTKRLLLHLVPLKTLKHRHGNREFLYSYGYRGQPGWNQSTVHHGQMIHPAAKPGHTFHYTAPRKSTFPLGLTDAAPAT